MGTRKDAMVSMESKRLLLLTGDPGIGKTTVMSKCAEVLKARGYSVGGMISREIRSCGSRVGFMILDINSDRRGWLAHVNQRNGPRVGRYRVKLEDLADIGVKSINEAINGSDAIVIDEIGPMELYLTEFREAVRKAVKSRKLVLSVIHWKARDSLLDEIRTRKDAETYEVTCENRDRLHDVIARRAIEFLMETGRG